MINSILRFGLIFILLILLQVLLFNNIQFSGYINPYVYIMFILLLAGRDSFLAASFIVIRYGHHNGFLFRVARNALFSYGSCRIPVVPTILRIVSPRDGYEARSEPSMLNYGFRWFLTYTVLNGPDSSYSSLLSGSIPFC